LKFNIILKQTQALDSHNIKTLQVIHSKGTNMRTKGNYHAKNYTTFKLFMHFYFTKEFHIIYQTQGPQKFNSKQQVYTTFNRQIHSKKSHVQSHNYVTKFQDQNHIKISQKY
jgi:hypothetical protein